jgi:hypothetical protein
MYYTIDHIYFPEHSDTKNSCIDKTINESLEDYLKTVNLFISTDYRKDFIENMNFEISINNTKLTVYINEKNETYETDISPEDFINIEYAYLTCFDEDMNTVFSKTKLIYKR